MAMLIFCVLIYPKIHYFLFRHLTVDTTLDPGWNIIRPQRFLKPVGS